MGGCLALHKFKCDIAPLLATLSATRLAAGNQGDDGKGSQAHTDSYIDDTHTFLHPDDIIPFLELLRRIGPPLGIHINFSKTQLLTTTTGISVRDQPPSPHNQTLIQALDYIRQQAPTGPNPEVTTGVRLLGQPLGSKAFATEYLLEAATTYSTNLDSLRTRLTDSHTKFLLYKSCAQPSLQHLITSDIYYHLDPTNPGPLDSWTSPFMAAITTADDQFLAHLGDVPHLPSTAKDIARHPVTLGGLGVRHFGRAAKTAFVLSLTRSLRYATPTLDHPPDTLHLTPERARPFISWDNPATTQPQFQTYQALAPQVLAVHNTTHPGKYLPTVHLKMGKR